MEYSISFGTRLVLSDVNNYDVALNSKAEGIMRKAISVDGYKV